MIQLRFSSLSLLALAAMAGVALGGCKDKSDSSQAGGTSTTTGSNASNSSGTSTDPGPAKAKRPDVTAPTTTASGDAIKLGLVASQSGDLKPWGIDCVNGVQLAADEFNATGGVNGKKVQILINDSSSKPEDGKSAAEKCVSDGAICLLGEVASGITKQMADVAYSKGLPIVAVGATRTDLSDIGSNFFRVCYTDDFQGPVMATFAYKELNLRNVALMTDNKQPYSVGLSNSFRKKFEELGGKIVDEEKYESGNTQFQSQLTNLKAKNPDGIFMSGYFTEVGPMARQIRDLGMKDQKLMGGDGWDSTQLVSGGGDAIVGGFFCNHYNNKEDRPEVKDFLAKWQKKYNGVPGTTMGALGYDAANLVFDALKRAKTPDSKSLIDSLADTTGFKGVSGVIDLKGHDGNPPKRAIVVEVTKTGQDFKKAYDPTSL